MRASWLLAVAIGLAFSAGAGANGYVVRPHAMPSAAAPHFASVAQVRPSIPPGAGFRHGDWHGHERWMFQRFGHSAFVYVLPTYVQEQYFDPDAADAAGDPSGSAPVVYAQAPSYAPYYPTEAPAVAPTPPKPAETITYATSGQPIDIPEGAHVTRGSVYKYTKDGVNTYTNVPPPGTAGAKMLFAYTEVVSTGNPRTMYRCAGSKPGSVSFTESPVPNEDCRSIRYDLSSAN